MTDSSINQILLRPMRAVIVEGMPVMKVHFPLMEKNKIHHLELKTGKKCM